MGPDDSEFGMIQYGVGLGETLSDIAGLCGVTAEEIYVHPLNEKLRTRPASSDMVHVGDVIWVPGYSTPEQPPYSEFMVGGAFDEDEDEDEEVSTRIWPQLFHASTRLVKYKVRSGDKLDVLAESCGCTWQQLAILNWATEEPDEINWYLGNDFVCKKKVGSNYIFTDDDEPGILLMPASIEASTWSKTRIVRATRFAV